MDDSARHDRDEDGAQDGARDGAESLILALDGFEGPLDVLLVLARNQKVDLKRISILELVDQYLAFVAAARRVRLELAADYLVMAAWLAYLKSRLLLPAPAPEEGPSGEELAARLARQLQRLEAIREVAARLMARDRLGRDVFPRGAPEGIVVVRNQTWEATLYDVLRAYADIRTQEDTAPFIMEKRNVYSMEAALARLAPLIGDVAEWQHLESFLPPDLAADPEARRSGLAGTFAATLELVRQGRLQIRQLDTFGPIHLRRATPGQRPGVVTRNTEAE
jgi:segregation and condensation protein A